MSVSSESEAVKIDGKEIAQQMRNRIKQEVALLIAEKGLTPGFAVIIVGTRGDSTTYVRMKEQASIEVGIRFVRVALPDTVSEAELLAKIDELNRDASIHGLIVQLPLPAHINEQRALDAVSYAKDIDGFHPLNIGAIAMRGRTPSFAPCTPEGVTLLLDAINVNCAGKHCVVLGRSNIVGVPIALLMLKRDATVTICHSKTANIQQEIERADILIAAIGKPKFVQGDWIKKGAIVIDVGTNSIPDATAKNGSRLVGDVDYATAKQRAAFITPVPGGVGPMTVATLLQHVLIGAKRTLSNENKSEH